MALCYTLHGKAHIASTQTWLPVWQEGREGGLEVGESRKRRDRSHLSVRRTGRSQSLEPHKRMPDAGPGQAY